MRPSVVPIAADCSSSAVTAFEDYREGSRLALQGRIRGNQLADLVAKVFLFG